MAAARSVCPPRDWILGNATVPRLPLPSRVGPPFEAMRKIFTRGEGRADDVADMKHLITLLALAATLTLGACAHHDSESMHMHQSTTTGYSK